jgi:hypothetical protein
METRSEIKPDGYSSPGFHIRAVKTEFMIFAPFRVLTLSRVKKKIKNIVENLATIEKTASSHKIILINQTPLPVPCQWRRAPAQWKEMLSLVGEVERMDE